MVGRKNKEQGIGNKKGTKVILLLLFAAWFLFTVPSSLSSIPIPYPYSLSLIPCSLFPNSGRNFGPSHVSARVSMSPCASMEG